MKAILPLAVVAVLTAGVHAQDATPPASLPKPTETLVVLGSAIPVPMAESSASVQVLPVQPELLKLESPLDLLRGDSSIFLEQRGAGGAQSDIVLRGGSFAQTLVLLNGLRIDDSQSAHHNLDLPVPMEAMQGVQVMHGAGSTLHGVDALDGAVDFLTAAPAVNSLLARAGGGSFGENEEALMGGWARGALSTRVTGNRNFSTGFITDRDYRNENAAVESWIGSRLGVTDLLFAGSDRAFGANQFYGNFNSWERTKGWLAAIRQELGPQTQAAFGYRRHTDAFVLFRNNPSFYENNHIDSSWQASLRRTEKLKQAGVLLAGIEEDGDGIHSYNLFQGGHYLALGIHARNRGAGYADVDLHPAKSRWSLSAGVREEIFSGGARSAFSPHLAGSMRVANTVKLRASGGYGFRVPTYTDLYYSDPATLGNARLRPESAWSGEGGVDWEASRRLSLSATGFYSRQHDTIDYVRAASVPNPHLPPQCPANKWCATNLSGLHFAGVETQMTWAPTTSQVVRISWTALHGDQDALQGVESEYTFNHPVQNVHGSWSVAFPHGIVLTNAVQIAQRYRSDAYPVWNGSVSRDRGMVRPYLRLSNLSNTGYQEIRGVNMPGRSIVGGLSLWLGGEKAHP